MARDLVEPTGPAPAGLLRSARRLRLRKHRAAEWRLLAEGPGAVREALAGGLVEALLATRAGAARHGDLTAGGWWEVDDKAMAELADTVTPSGLLAICRWEPARGLPGRPGRRPETGPPGPGRGPRPPAGPAGAGRGPEEPSPDPALVVVCAQIRDPGNLGTVIRCADAFGATAVVVTAGSVDPANAKAVRASAGSLFHVPVLSGVPLADAVADLREQAFTILAADMAGARDLTDLTRDGTLAGDVAWVLGNEAWGLPPEDAALADEVVRVPMRGRAESLNLASAAAVCLYATATAR